MMTTEISTAREQQLFNGKNFHVVIYNKTESVGEAASMITADLP